MKKRMSRMSETAGAEVIDSQLNFFLRTLIQVHKLQLNNFKLSIEVKSNDINLIYADKNEVERCCLLRTKHVIDESKTLSFNDLISGDKFNLTKYFDSSKEIINEEQFKHSLEYLILFTNLNLSQSFLPYVEEVQPPLPIWNCKPLKDNDKQPRFYKLTSKFIDNYQYSPLRALSNAIIDYCNKDIELKHTNKYFINCHVLLAREVFNTEEKCFRKEFINGELLQPETQVFREVFEGEIKKRSTVGDTLIWLQSVRFIFSKEFGLPSSSKGSNFWPIPLKPDDKESFTKFCSHLVLALHQSTDVELEECWTSQFAEYFSESMANIAKAELKFKIREWFKANGINPINCQFLDDAIEYIKNNEKEVDASYVGRCEIAELFNQKIEFETLSLLSDIEMFMNAKGTRLLQITTRHPDLSSIKIICCLRKINYKYLFTSKNDIEELNKVFNKSKYYNLLIWQQLGKGNTAKDLKLLFHKKIQNKGKKVIVIINESQTVSAPQSKAAEDWIQRVNDETQFVHLTEDTRNRLLKRNVSFQGYDIEINKILEDGIRLDQVANDSWGDLLISGNIQIGQKVNLSEDYNVDYYIPRTIVLGSTNNETQQSLIEEEFIQLAMLNDKNQSLEETTGITSNYVGCKVFILSEEAWMGKSTVSSSLAVEIKRNHPYCWVTRLDATDCASDLNHFDESITSDAFYDDFFVSQVLKLSSLEKIVFGQYLKKVKSVNKFVLIFDGYDKINQKCQRVITKLLQHFSRKLSSGFILITTTPQFQQDSERDLQQRACALEPFDEQNKIEFMRRYWTSRVITVDFIRITEYAEHLIKCISRSITETEPQLTDNFLQLRMIAEVYENEAQCYAQNGANGLGPSVTTLGLFDFYEKFIQIKEQKWLNKNEEDQDLPFIRYVFESYQQNQSKFARQFILKQSEDVKIEASELERTTQLGIIQRNQEGKFYFIHRTFPEFLTAKYLVDQIIEKDSVPVADKIKNGLLIEQIKDVNLYVVRKFINSRLDSSKLAEECMRSENKTTLQKLLGEKFISIIVTAAEEELNEFLKFAIEVNCWLEPDQIYKKLKACLLKAEKNSNCLTAILNCMLDKWLPSKDIILLKTLDSLIRNILVNCEDNGAHRKALTTSTIEFMNALEKAGILTEEKLGIILSNAKDEVNRGGYWNWHTIEYLKHLLSTHRILFYDFLNDNRSLLYNIMKSPNDISYEFLELIQNDKNINAEWIFENFIEQEFTEFTEWEGDHFQSYLTSLHFTAATLNAERLETFRCYLKEVLHFIYRQFDYSWTELYSEFLGGYERFISLDQITSTFNTLKTVEDLEYCVIWGQTEKLKEILTEKKIEKAAVEQFQLFGGIEDLAAIRRRILNSIEERQGGAEAFQQLFQQRNWRKSTILQNALWRGDDLIIEQISKWITTQEIFEEIMTIDDRLGYIQSEVVSFLDFVNERFPQYRMRFIEINKNIFILMNYGTEAIFRIIEKDENMGKDEFMKILKLQVDSIDCKGTTIIHDILVRGELSTLKELLYLMKKYSLDAGSIKQLFSIEDKDNVNPLDSIESDSIYIRRQKKKELLFDFFNELNLIELKDKISNQVGVNNDNVQEIQPANGFLRRFTPIVRKLQSLIR